MQYDEDWHVIDIKYQTIAIQPLSFVAVFDEMPKYHIKERKRNLKFLSLISRREKEM